MLSDEQKQVLFDVLNPDIKTIKINAIAGSGKTHLLIQIVKVFKPNNALYLAYNKSIADESAKKFNENTVCATTHSLAYQHTIKRYGIYTVVQSDVTGRVFNVHSIKFPEHITNDKQLLQYHRDNLEHLDYSRKDLIAKTIKDFFVSKYTKYVDFITNDYPDILEPEEILLGSCYLELMKKGSVSVTHGFYLKLFHVLLHNKKISIDNYDLLMLDEAGDINPVTLEIFKLINCNKKVMVGDDKQNIYSFNQTINGFKELISEKEAFDLTKSFRVSQAIAEKVEVFCKNYLDPNMTFAGREYNHNEYPDKFNQVTAYISRTNSFLVERMVELDKQHIAYSLTRSAESIFRLHRAIIFVKPGGETHDPDLQFIQNDIDEWANSEKLQREHKTKMGYLLYKNESNVQVRSAVNSIMKFGSKTILDVYKKAKQHEASKDAKKIILTTAHASKGCEYDNVYIMDDLNSAIEDLIEVASERLEDNHLPKTTHISKILNKLELEEFRLYYVACTRAKFRIENAQHLSSEENIII